MKKNKKQKLNGDKANVMQSLPLLSEEEWKKYIDKTDPEIIRKARSIQFKKGMYAGYLTTIQWLEEYLSNGNGA